MANIYKTKKYKKNHVTLDITNAPEPVQVLTLNRFRFWPWTGSGSGNVPESSSEDFWDELVQVIYLNFQVIHLK